MSLFADFTDSELAFLDRQGISQDEVYDGTREGKLTRERRAKEAGKLYILTSSPCRASGHRLRTRAGHCMQCDTKKIAYMRRETLAGYVYLAGSLKGRLIKVGQTQDIYRRAARLKAESYGGFSDWNVLISAWVSNSGEKEREVSLRISGRRVSNGYFKDGEAQTGVEMIRCSFSSALSAFEVVTLAMIFDRKALLDRHRQYEFDQSIE